ncbi:hypothetical protein E2C01_065819 [Portunus trituberculatus]|uniref:Uncharacterized protein n=1 Tax=Portunus trituberculatus TaxID=210409 RepID=A0A5B7HFM1_PORTR|nr:hypothetical protein [Portunus trituberculatus]
MLEEKRGYKEGKGHLPASITQFHTKKSTLIFLTSCLNKDNLHSHTSSHACHCCIFSLFCALLLELALLTMLSSSDFVPNNNDSFN